MDRPGKLDNTDFRAWQSYAEALEERLKELDKKYSEVCTALEYSAKDNDKLLHEKASLEKRDLEFIEATQRLVKSKLDMKKRLKELEKDNEILVNKLDSATRPGA